MNLDPKVSVFLPTYNQKDYIAESIDSVLSQDYKNIEIVIGDDCSTDGTWEIIQQYVKKNSDKLKTFRNEENIGITRNCNAILKRCTGDFIAYSAGDDLYLPGKLSKQVGIMQADEQCIMTHHYVETFDSATNRTLEINNKFFKNKKVLTEPSSAVLRSIIKNGNSYVHGLSVMIRRNAVPEHGFDNRIPVASDWLMWVDILATSLPNSKVIFIPELFARYRRHQSNVTAIGYKHTDDMYVTLAIMEDRYPYLIESVESARATIRSLVGVKMIKENKDLRNGRKLISRSIFGGKLTLYNIYWLIYTLFPRIHHLGSFIKNK